MAEPWTTSKVSQPTSSSTDVTPFGGRDVIPPAAQAGAQKVGALAVQAAERLAYKNFRPAMML